jgi:hypothetical protein
MLDHVFIGFIAIKNIANSMCRVPINFEPWQVKAARFCVDSAFARQHRRKITDSYGRISGMIPLGWPDLTTAETPGVPLLCLVT